MKKNLFGAVAAGLALALAITSFGCESGNDDPIARPEFADLAAVKGSKFTYVAAPTEYTYKAETAGISVDASGSYKTIAAVDDGWTVTRYVNGVQSYNRKAGTTPTYKNVDKSKPEVGDVLNTKSETIVLNAGDKTFTWTADSSAYEVKGIRLSAASAQGDGLSYDTLPFYFSNLTTTFAVANAAPYYTPGNVDSTVADTDNGWKTVEAIFGKEADGSAATPTTIIGKAYAAYLSAADTFKNNDTPSKKAAYDAAEGDSAKVATDYGAAKKAMDDAKKVYDQVVELKALAALYKEGARASVLETETKGGVTTGDISYYKDLSKSLAKVDSNTNFIKKVSKADGTAASTTGVYTISTNDYKNAAITLTTYKSGSDTIVFNSDDTYTKNGVLAFNKVDVDFPKATTRVVVGGTAYTGNKLQKAARVLTIANGTLTAPRYITSYTDCTSVSDDHVLNNGFLLNSSYTTYAAATKDAGTAAAATGTLDQAVSYSYICK